MSNICPACTHRVSDWQMASGKAIQINGEIYHITCLGDLRIKDLTDKQLLDVVNRRAKAS